MKVLLVGNYLPDRQDSMQIYASMLEEGLRARGHEVCLLQPPAVLGPRVAENSPLFKWLGYADKFVLFRRELRRAARSADIVHLCDHSNAMYVPALAHTAHVITCHDVLAIRSAMRHFPENPVSGTGRMFQRLIARGLRRAGAIICVSGKTRDDLKQYLAVPEDRLHVIPNGLAWPYRPLDAEASAPLLAPLGLRPGEPYFLNVGGNHWYKNRGAAIEIFAELRKLSRYAGARLVMAGGPMMPELRAIAEKCRSGRCAGGSCGAEQRAAASAVQRRACDAFPFVGGGIRLADFGSPGVRMPGCDQGPAADERCERAAPRS